MNLTELLKDLSKTKRSQAPLWDHLQKVNHPKWQKIRDCGSWLHLREWLDHEGKTTVTNANFCKTHLMCNLCAIRRAAVLVNDYTVKAESVIEENPGLIPAMITWTVKNGDDLEERFLHIKNARQKVGEMARNHRKRKNPPAVLCEFTAVKGGVYHFEIKRGKGGSWHPHIHEFVLMDRYIDQAKLSGEWESFTGDSKIVGVTECKNGILEGMLEVLKYATKFSEASPEDIVAIQKMAKGSRLVSNHGILRGVPEPDIDSDEDLTGPYIDYVAMWMFKRAGYALKRFEDAHEDVSTRWMTENPNKFDKTKPQPISRVEEKKNWGTAPLR